MRIAVSGSFSVGKTTVIKGIEQYFAAGYRNDIITIGNISRDLVNSGKVKHDKGSEFYHYFLYISEYAKRLVDAKAAIVLHDRTLLDSMAYMITNGNIPPEFLEMLENLVRWYVKDIDVYFYIPIEIAITEDGVRSYDEQYRIDVDRKILEYLTRFFVNYVTLSGTVNQRMLLVKNTLDKHVKLDIS